MAPHSPPSPRKPLPQPIEETKSSNSTSLAKERSTNGKSMKTSRALPQPIETSTVSSKKTVKESDLSRDGSATHSGTGQQLSPQPNGSSSASTKPRRFAPQMIETSRRSRRNTDEFTGLDLAQQTDVDVQHPEHSPQLRGTPRPSPLPLPPDNTPKTSSNHVHQAPESKFSSSRLVEKATRRHSFRVPDLQAIESSESESGNSETTSTASTATSDPKTSRKRRKKKKERLSQNRESQDERYSGYLISLAAKAAEKQMRDQAMAAYPNEKQHEPVDHYAFDRDSGEFDVHEGVERLGMGGTTAERDRQAAARKRRDSDADTDMAEMRRHRDKLDQQRQNQWAVGDDQSELDRQHSIKKEGLAQDRLAEGAAPAQENLGWQKDNEVKAQRKAASPPMAGQNLRYPKCQSPQATRLDVNNYPSNRSTTGTQTHEHTGLWTPSGGASREPSTSGLWNGVNGAAAQPAHAPPKVMQTGLLTPSFERTEFLSSTASNTYSSHQLPPSPPSSQEDNTLDSRLKREASIDAELSDAFVTQVYNYLSLGYPTLARPFDEELAKITATPIEKLRKDDGQCNAKGYVGAPEGTGMDVRGVSEGACERWVALRKYVREWGRQQPDMGERDQAANADWGARARRGSWAI